MLKLNRKEGQAIEIRHRGETLVIQVAKIRRSKTALTFAGPRTFAVLRPETFIEKEEMVCFVQVSDDPSVERLQLAAVIGRSGEGEDEMVEVEFQDGRRQKISSEKVRIVRKEQP